MATPPAGYFTYDTPGSWDSLYAMLSATANNALTANNPLANAQTAWERYGGFGSDFGGRDFDPVADALQFNDAANTFRGPWTNLPAAAGATGVGGAADFSTRDLYGAANRDLIIDDQQYIQPATGGRGFADPMLWRDYFTASPQWFDDYNTTALDYSVSQAASDSMAGLIFDALNPINAARQSAADQVYAHGMDILDTDQSQLTALLAQRGLLGSSTGTQIRKEGKVKADRALASLVRDALSMFDSTLNTNAGVVGRVGQADQALDAVLGASTSSLPTSFSDPNGNFRAAGLAAGQAGASAALSRLVDTWLPAITSLPENPYSGVLRAARTASPPPRPTQGGGTGQVAFFGNLASPSQINQYQVEDTFSSHFGAPGYTAGYQGS